MQVRRFSCFIFLYKSRTEEYWFWQKLIFLQVKCFKSRQSSSGIVEILKGVFLSFCLPSSINNVSYLMEIAGRDPYNRPLLLVPFWKNAISYGISIVTCRNRLSCPISPTCHKTTTRRFCHHCTCITNTTTFFCLLPARSGLGPNTTFFQSVASKQDWGCNWKYTKVKPGTSLR